MLGSEASGRLDSRAAKRGGPPLPNRGSYRFLAAATSLAFSMIGALLAGYFGGRWLDLRLGTRPWLTLLGLLLGIAAGLVALFRILTSGGDRS